MYETKQNLIERAILPSQFIHDELGIETTIDIPEAPEPWSIEDFQDLYSGECLRLASDATAEVFPYES